MGVYLGMVEKNPIEQIVEDMRMTVMVLSELEQQYPGKFKGGPEEALRNSLREILQEYDRKN
jgi:hypothetical protein